VPKSLFSLFQVLTRDKWSSSLVWPLVEGSAGLVIIFILFLCIAMLALLNTIIGVVVESTLRSARENEEKVAKEKQKLDEKIMHSLEQIFKEADTDGSGDLDQQELAEAMKNPKVKKALSALGISITDLELLFSLLDEDGSGNIKTDMFFRGCTRLRGPAMARDLQTISVDLDRHVQTSTDHIKQLRHLNDDISSILDIIDTIEVDIVKDPQDEKDPVLQARRGRERESRGARLRSNKTGEGAPSDVSSEATDFSEPLPTVGRKEAGRRISNAGPTKRPGQLPSLRNAGLGSTVYDRPAVQPPPPPLPPNLRQGNWVA